MKATKPTQLYLYKKKNKRRKARKLYLSKKKCMVLIIVFTAGASIFTIRVQLYGVAIHFDRWGSILKVPDIYYSHRNPKVIVPIVIYNENPYCIVGWNKTRDTVCVYVLCGMEHLQSACEQFRSQLQ